MSDNEILKRLKAAYVGASGDSLIEFLEAKRKNALQRMLNTTDHVEMLQCQSEYKVYAKMIELKDVVRKL